MLLCADAGLLFVLAHRLSLSSAASLFAVAAWMFNFHGINMALLLAQRKNGVVALPLFDDRSTCLAARLASRRSAPHMCGDALQGGSSGAAAAVTAARRRC
jgi:hypothetical protein